MATNLFNFLRSRSRAANSLLIDGEYDRSRAAHEELLSEPRLPWSFRVKADANLIELVDEWRLKDMYRVRAEEAYAKCLLLLPADDQSDSAGQENMREMRAVLDMISAELESSCPSAVTEQTLHLEGFVSKNAEERDQGVETSAEESSLPQPSKAAAQRTLPPASNDFQEPPSSSELTERSDPYSSSSHNDAKHFVSDPITMSGYEGQGSDDDDDGGVTLTGLEPAPIGFKK